MHFATHRKKEAWGRTLLTSFSVCLWYWKWTPGVWLTMNPNMENRMKQVAKETPVLRILRELTK